MIAQIFILLQYSYFMEHLRRVEFLGFGMVHTQKGDDLFFQFYTALGCIMDKINRRRIKYTKMKIANSNAM